MLGYLTGARICVQGKRNAKKFKNTKPKKGTCHSICRDSNFFSLRCVPISPVNSGGLGSLLRRNANGGEEAHWVDIGTCSRQTGGRRVDADGDVANQAVRDIIAQQIHVDDRAVAIRARRAVQRVLRVGRPVQGLEMGAVGADGVHLAQQALLEKELANVLDGALAVPDAGADVGLGGDVDVRGARNVVAGELGQELDHAFVVGDLDSAQKGLVVGRSVIPRSPAIVERSRVRIDTGKGGVCLGGSMGQSRVLTLRTAGRISQIGYSKLWAERAGTLMTESHTGTSGVASPDGQGNTGKRLACLNVDHPHIEIEVNAGLVLPEIVADHLAVDTRKDRY